jgi:glycosyltransferase involved in cell wall biosynthesis
MKNVFYFKMLNSIGGVESWLYYLSKLYKNMVVYYKSGDPKQVERLSKNVECHRYTNQKIKCDRFFCMYNPDIIDNVEAEEYINVIHSDYKGQNIKPVINEKFTKTIAVSKSVAKTYKELTGIDCEVIYNPVALDKPKPLLKLISATRLTREKGKERMELLGKILDKKGIQYQWLVFTNDRKVIDNDNIVYMYPRLDITSYMADSDYLVQLSDCEAYCYSVVEMLMLGKPVIITDLPVYKEIGITEDMSIKLPLDFKDIDIKRIEELKGKKIKYSPPKEEWNRYLDNETRYNPDTKVLVKPIKTFTDIQRGERVDVRSDPYIVDLPRAIYLENMGLIEIKEVIDSG